MVLKYGFLMALWYGVGMAGFYMFSLLLHAVNKEQPVNSSGCYYCISKHMTIEALQNHCMHT